MTLDEIAGALRVAYGYFPEANTPTASVGFVPKALSDIIFACYDGRESGGTYYTINLAKKLEKPCIILSPC